MSHDPPPTDRPAAPRPVGSRPGPPWPLVAAALVLIVAGGLVAAGAVVLGSAARDPSPAAQAPRPATPPTIPPGEDARVVTYRLEPGGRPPVRVRLDVAADPATRARGLMGRERLPAGTGMVFLFPADVRGAFWMKNTLVPLSIAFVAADGRVVGVLEMAPCQADPCPSYGPPGAYRYAVELPAGAFRAAGIDRGDRVVPEDPASLPRAS
jgi:uncharacterized protein